MPQTKAWKARQQREPGRRDGEPVLIAKPSFRQLRQQARERGLEGRLTMSQQQLEEALKV